MQKDDRVRVNHLSIWSGEKGTVSWKIQTTPATSWFGSTDILFGTNFPKRHWR